MQGSEPQHHVVQGLDVDAAHSEHDQGSDARCAGEAHDGLQVASCHLLHHDAVDARFLPGALGLLGALAALLGFGGALDHLLYHCPHCALHLCLVLEAQRHTTHVCLVHDIG